MKTANKIIAFRADGKGETLEFANSLDCAKAFGLSRQSVYRAINEGVMIKKYFFDLKINEYEQTFINNRDFS